jgi:ribosomal protein S18 acetylase RimI-like enzyme
MENVRFEISPRVSDADLNELFAAAWPSHVHREFAEVLRRSLLYVCAFIGNDLAGFVNVAWDGRTHAFLLDPTVRPQCRRRGIGTELVLRAVKAARQGPCEWIHVDCEAGLSDFYRRCGFRATSAGLISLKDRPASEGAPGARNGGS